MSKSKKELALWRMPIILAALILFGLLDALLIDNEAARILAWVVLAVPLVAAARSLFGAWSGRVGTSGAGQ